jgi:methionyl-tRNA formyltransferase
VRVVFLGTAAFAVPSLLAVYDAGHEVAAAVTQPERAGSRGRPAPRPVADAARDLGLQVLQPEKVRAPEAVASLLALRADALVVASYGQILPAALLDGPRFGGVNVHASVLPRWRGASPVAAAILAGDEETGVSIMRMEAGLDTGPVYAVRTLPIGPGVTTPDLTADLARVGANLLVEVLAGIEDGSAVAEPQDAGEATYAPRLTRADGVLDWAQLSAVEVDRRVRALQPWPGTVAALAGAEVRIVAGAVANSPGSNATGAAKPSKDPSSGHHAAGLSDASTAPPGTLLAAGPRAVDVSTRDGVYSIHELQAPGRRPMDAAAYLRGRRVSLPAAPVAAG